MDSIKVSLIVTIGIYAVTTIADGRHVPLTGQATKPPRTRLLVIRPPPGTNQPNRVLLITDPRKLPSDTGSFRRDPKRDEKRTRATDPFSTGRVVQDDQKVKAQPQKQAPGGHPQSQIRRQGGQQSLRTLLDDLRNQRARKTSNSQPSPDSNIAGLPRTVPRAASISTPTDAGFGDVNMPTAMEAALKTLREQVLRLGRMRKQPPSNIRVPDRNPVMNRNLLKLLRASMAGQALPPAGRNFGSGRFSGNVGTVDSPQTTRQDRENIGSNLRTRAPVSNIAGSSTSSEKETGKQSTSVKASKKRIINSDTSVISNGGVQSPVASSKVAKTSNIKVHNSTGTDKAGSSNLDLFGPKGDGVKGQVKGGVSINATAALHSSAAKAERNTTETKSLKTKNIKVTTVIKGGTAADVAAAAASQAEIANAVAQGKEINSSSLAAIAAAAAAPKTTKPPVGSITVKREPNGDSVITLSDGQGEPVILRASGPIKIERIIKPNGKVQFLINPIKPPVIDPDMEPEDFTTTAQTTTGSGQTYSYPEGSTTQSIFATPTFIPSIPFNPFYDSPTTTVPPMPLNPMNDQASILADLLPPTEQSQQSPGEQEVTSKKVSHKTEPASTKASEPAIKSQSQRMKGPSEASMPLDSVGHASGAGTVGNNHLPSGGGIQPRDVKDIGMGPKSKIPRPPLLSDSLFGPFDMLNSVIDFNKNIPRPSVDSHIESIQTTFTPLLSKTSISEKKIVPSGDLMPQYDLVSSSPPLKIVPQEVP